MGTKWGLFLISEPITQIGRNVIQRQVVTVPVRVIALMIAMFQVFITQISWDVIPRQVVTVVEVAGVSEGWRHNKSCVDTYGRKDG